MKGSVLFGSQSDKVFFDELLSKLRPVCDVTFDVLSAHRDCEQLRELCRGIETQFVVAGAGLSAALPGVIAAQTKVPVFGLPVSTCFGGFDAFLSSLQMPAGTPVATCAPNNEEAIVHFLEAIRSDKWSQEKMVNVYVDPIVEPYEYICKAIKTLRELAERENIKLTVENRYNPECWNILLVHQEKEIVLKPHCLHVPMMDKQAKDNPSRALTVLGQAERGGLWFGVNNVTNALLWLKRVFENF